MDIVHKLHNPCFQWHVLFKMADDKLTNLGRPKRLASVPRFLSSQACAKQEIRKKLKKVCFFLCQSVAIIIKVELVPCMSVAMGRFLRYFFGIRFSFEPFITNVTSVKQNVQRFFGYWSLPSVGVTDTNGFAAIPFLWREKKDLKYISKKKKKKKKLAEVTLDTSRCVIWIVGGGKHSFLCSSLCP